MPALELPETGYAEIVYAPPDGSGKTAVRVDVYDLYNRILAADRAADPAAPPAPPGEGNRAVRAVLVQAGFPETISTKWACDVWDALAGMIAESKKNAPSSGSAGTPAPSAPSS